MTDKLQQALSIGEWNTHNIWESNWWGDCCDTFHEQLKQDQYIKYMKINQYAVEHHFPERSFDLRGKSILDIGGGPVSILLRCFNFSKGVVVDPCVFPKWVIDRYDFAGITFMNRMAESVEVSAVDEGVDRFDEAWCYNVLQHVQNPADVINTMKRSARKVRICEYCNIGVCMGHPWNLTKEMLDSLFGYKGLVEPSTGLLNGLVYFGVFRYE